MLKPSILLSALALCAACTPQAQDAWTLGVLYHDGSYHIEDHRLTQEDCERESQRFTRNHAVSVVECVRGA